MLKIEFFYAAHSAFAYIGMARLLEIAQKGQAQIVHRPMNLGLVVRGAYPDGLAQRTPANKNYFFGREIERWALHRGVPMGNGIPHNHRNDVTLANSVLIAASLGERGADGLARALMGAHWVDQADLADETLLAEIANKQGLDGAALLSRAKGQAVAEIYKTNIREAIERCVFGSPTYFVEGDMFFGQDHLELVETALEKPFSKSWEQS